MTVNRPNDHKYTNIFHCSKTHQKFTQIGKIWSENTHALWQPCPRVSSFGASLSIFFRRGKATPLNERVLETILGRRPTLRRDVTPKLCEHGDQISPNFRRLGDF
jgi:hypothetical protein